ncbi:MAG: response regulator [Bdellovibrionaceae bacterium]|jgi:CheY-like chemotaxis protein|nr:response regulator [Pseudobdellovibrionaceae bacterium]
MEYIKSNFTQGALNYKENHFGTSIKGEQLNYNILIVEDDLFSQKLFSHIISKITLQRSNFIIADNYVDTIEKLQLNLHFNLAIVDVNLDGDLSGIDVFKVLHKKFNSIPVIMTSSLKKNKVESELSKFIHKPLFLQKPFTPQLCELIIQEIGIDLRM